MAIIHHCLFAARPAALLDFCQAAKSYMATPVGTLVDDVKEAFQGSASVMEGGNDRVFDIWKKNVLGVLLPLSRASVTDWTICGSCGSCHPLVAKLSLAVVRGARYVLRGGRSLHCLRRSCTVCT
ncbi:hypothetical protein JOM56_009670 [Amanita muscaria]